MYKYSRLLKTLNWKDWCLGFRSMFANAQALEQLNIDALIEKFEFTDALLFGSGREAFRHILSLLPKGKEEVIIPAYGCRILFETVCVSGKKPILVDLERQSVHPNVDAVLKCVTERTAAIVIVHEYGRLFSVEDFKIIRENFKGVIVEDAAIAMASRYPGGARVGSLGNYTLFSGGIGKPHSCFSWGAVGSKGLMMEAPVFRVKKSSCVSAFYSLIYLFIQCSVIYSVVRPMLSKMVSADSSRVPLQLKKPSSFDCGVMLNRLKYLDRLNSKRCSVLGKIVSSYSGNYSLLACDRSVDTCSRLLILIFSETAKKKFNDLCVQKNIEPLRPYQYGFGEEFVNSEDMRSNLFALVIHQKSDFVVRVNSILESL